MSGAGSNARRPGEPRAEDEREEEELVAFFLALPPEARREYALLAELDRRYGEDVEAEHAAAVKP